MRTGVADFPVVAEEIARLIGLLDDDSADVAEDAKAKLISIGHAVIEPLIAALTSLERYGQLSAIEIFEHCGNAAAGPVLAQLLSSEHGTVREWSALALAQLSIQDAVPALRAAYRRQRVSGDGPDFTEAVAIRHALTVLGARRAVVPPLTASLRAPVTSLDQAWPAERLEEVINELAGYRQAVLYLQVWEVSDRGVFWQRHDMLDRDFDWAAPWPQLVAEAREYALLEAAFIPRRENLAATVEWIDEKPVQGSGQQKLPPWPSDRDYHELLDRTLIWDQDHLRQILHDSRIPPGRVARMRFSALTGGERDGGRHPPRSAVRLLPERAGARAPAPAGCGRGAQAGSNVVLCMPAGHRHRLALRARVTG
jgi:HEAT repeat protein